MNFDLLMRSGTTIDDNGLQDGRTAAFAPGESLEGRYTLDALRISGAVAVCGGQPVPGERRGWLLRR